MTFRRIDVGMIPAYVGRMTYTGDLGYEIWVAPEYQRALFDLLWQAGKPYGIGLFGFRALMSLRMEKMFGTWAREYRPIYTAVEARMHRSLKLDHDFIGRAAVEAELARSPARTLGYFDITPDPAEPADVVGDEPIWHGGAVVGWVTSGAYAHYSRRSLAFGYLPSELVVPGAMFEVEIIGQRRPARLLPEPVLDPAGHRMRV
jgi:dimethylglycine dehydrogenase